MAEPVRVSAIRATRPVPIISASSVQPAGPGLVPGAVPRPCGSSSAEHGELADEARQRRQPGDHQGAHQTKKGQADEGGGGDHAADQHLPSSSRFRPAVGTSSAERKGASSSFSHRGQGGAAVAPALNQVSQEQRRHGQRGAGQVVQQAGREPILAKAGCGQQRARRQHGRVAGQVRQGAASPSCRWRQRPWWPCRPGAQAAKLCRGPGIGAKQQRPQAQQRVQPDLWS